LLALLRGREGGRVPLWDADGGWGKVDEKMRMEDGNGGKGKVVKCW